MIKVHNVADGFVVSQGGTFLPGIYESEDAAGYAPVLREEILRKLQRATNPRGDGVITEKALREATA